MPSCSQVREELVQCMQKSPCMEKYGYPIKKCFEKEYQIYVPEECQAIRKAYSSCKRTLVRNSKLLSIV
ncbi:Dephospho-CoA kinase (Dephosphocoenzyme A kinase) (COAE), variant 2 [Entomophthora muscae]|uniref:Dephospho-CoA kinase (Dephosphocoenzyme A kinase) (COAE), variant 2 n=1 Tax=Entomophthora muscae TaxID=34485 RepID=A0ACC2TRH3_9FUNG|nr:Dephospho-CoA kinase (Dephosphocoenzyme A kinase) (COAE), variant 2 [Entomophthora muscae]